jgi:hypothetical protein
MGLFSSKYKTYVGTSASRLIQDDLIPSSVISGTLRGILQDKDLPNAILTDLFRSVGSRVRSMHNFAKNRYVFGTPGVKRFASSAHQPAVQAVLDTLEGQPVSIEYLHIGAPNILHITWLKLVQNHGYNTANNRLNTLSTTLGKDVYLDDILVVIPQSRAGSYLPIATAQWGQPPNTRPSPNRKAQFLYPELNDMVNKHSAVRVDPAATDDFARVLYAYDDTPTGPVISGSFDITNSEYADSSDFVQVSYYVGGVKKYWIYEVGSAVHPTLDNVLTGTSTAEDLSKDFFPFIHFRTNKQRISVNQNSVQYLDSVKICKKLGVSYDELDEAIHANPDIGDVAQAYIGLMVPASSADKDSCRYLFDFFSELYDSGYNNVDPWVVGRAINTEWPREAITVADSLVKHTLSSTGISKRVIAGTVTGLKVGETSSQVIAAVEAEPVDVTTQEALEPKPRVPSFHCYRRQITDSTYEEIQVQDLEMRYFIEGDHSDVETETSVSLLVPLDYSITRNYSLQFQERLYSKALHVIVNSVQVVKVKWYQQSFFSTILFIIAIVMAVYDYGATLAAVTTLYAFVQFVVVTILISYATKKFFEFLVKELGVESALFLAVVAAIVGGANWAQAGTTGLPATAAQLLQVSLNLVKASGTVVMEDLAGLATEFSALQDEMTEKNELLKKAQDLLQETTRFNPMIIFGESPENFFNRTVHSGNVGTIGYKAIDSYVDMALTLPTISDTLPEELPVY